MRSLEFPSSVPFRGPRLGEAFEGVVVRDLDGVALNHNVYSSVPLVAARVIAPS